MDVLQRAEYYLAFFGDDKDDGDDDSVDLELAMGVDEVQEDAEGAGGGSSGQRPFASPQAGARDRRRPGPRGRRGSCCGR